MAPPPEGSHESGESSGAFNSPVAGKDSVASSDTAADWRNTFGTGSGTDAVTEHDKVQVTELWESLKSVFSSPQGDGTGSPEALLSGKPESGVENTTMIAAAATMDNSTVLGNESEKDKDDKRQGSLVESGSERTEPGEALASSADSTAGTQTDAAIVGAAANNSGSTTPTSNIDSSSKQASLFRDEQNILQGFTLVAEDGNSANPGDSSGTSTKEV